MSRAKVCGCPAYEAYHADAEKYQAILARISDLHFRKRRRFTANAIKDLDDFVSQQLNETRYISRKAVEYLQQLGVKIEPVKGGTTALLRRAWGLNRVLGNSGEKERADHRHHAVDALVCALTDRAAVQKLNRYAALSAGRLRIEGYPSPISDLRERAKPVIRAITVSHKPARKVKGPLHEETLYAFTGRHDDQGNSLVRLRKPLATLGAKDLDLICDARIRELAKAHLARHGGDFKAAFGQSPTSFGFEFDDEQGTHFRPVNKVRLEYPLGVRAIGKGRRKRHVKTGSNHHLEIFESSKNGRTKWVGRVVSTMDAVGRLKQTLPVIDDHHDSGQYLMALHINDMLEIEHRDERLICFVQKMSSKSSGQIEIVLRPHFDATEKKERTFQISKSPESLRKAKAKLIHVDVLGEIRGGND